jgi:integrase/recombinase XerD
VIDMILEEHAARVRHSMAPLLEERKRFLSHLLGRGTSPQRVRTIAAYLLQVIRLMGLTTLRSVEIDEIKAAAERWADYQGPDRRRKGGTGAHSLTNVAKKWFRFHGKLIIPSLPPHPFEPELADFAQSMRSTRRLSPATIKGYSSKAAIFLKWVAPRYNSLSSVCLRDVDEYLAEKTAAGWTPRTLAAQGQAMRSFFVHAAERGWCAPGLNRGIRTPAIPKYDAAPKGPGWREVRRLLKSTAAGTKPSTLRARAVLLLCSVYGLRSSEITSLRLSDFNWRDEIFTVQRAKRGGLQRYPIQYEVGEAILGYLTRARPRCPCRHVFLTLHPPFRPVDATSIWQITSRRFKRLKIDSIQKGPHSLRHACATHLLRKGASLKEIAEFLGHRDVGSVGIYAKYDSRSLGKVAAFRLTGLA